MNHFEIENDFWENAIRFLAIEDKNYLLLGPHESAQKMAMIYFLFASCKVNQREPFRWCTDVLTIIPGHNVIKLNGLVFSIKRFAKFKLAIRRCLAVW